MEDSRVYKVSIQVLPVPESAGLRIRSLDPIGLYISSFNRPAAEWYFETRILQLLVELKILPMEHGSSLSLDKQPDWQAFLETGHGEIPIKYLTPRNVRELKKESSPIVNPPVEKLRVQWWKTRLGTPFCLISDNDAIDSWLLDSVKEDLSKEDSTIQ